jgi:Xaa-Pro aminopeptidase
MPRFSPALTYGPTNVDWQERINFEKLRSQRAERMRKIMKKNNCPVILATGASNIRYLTGLTGPDFAPGIWYVLFFAEADPVVFAHAGYIYHYMRECPWIPEWRLARSWLNGICGPEATAEEADKFAAEVAEVLDARGMKDEPLSIMGFDGTAQSALKNKGLNVRSGSALMTEASARKMDEELKCVRMVAAIAETAWYKVMEHLRPGVVENELSRIGRETISQAGADIAKVGFRSGPLTFERGMKDTGRIIQAGEILYGNLCSTKYMGYGACLYRTFYVGDKPGQRETEWYKRLLDRMDAIIDAIRPGATTADAARCFAPASDWGYEDELAVLTIEIGHGVGLRQYEMPVINRQWSLKHPQVFEPGMVIAVESREGEAGRGAVRLEDMVIVTEEGAEIIDRFPRDRITAVPF